MALTLYGAPLSPFVRKVRLFLGEKAEAYQLEIVLPFGQPDWFREISPLGRALKPSMGQPCDEAAVQKALGETLPIHFDYLEKTLGGATYFVGEQLSLADLAIACQLINMEHGGEQLDAHRWPQLEAFYQCIKARPSVQALLPGEQKMLSKMAAKA